jgi:hypothetical protein
MIRRRARILTTNGNWCSGPDVTLLAAKHHTFRVLWHAHNSSRGILGGRVVVDLPISSFECLLP